MGLAASHVVGPSIRTDNFNPLNVDTGLSQSDTNGASIWGTLDVPTVSEFLTDNPLPNGRPWGLFDSQTNYYEEVPETGKVRPYNFTISNGLIAPDGYERPVLLVNGAFPGPLIEANWGDIIEVTVTNNITEPLEGLAIHWHGLFHRSAPWEDGAPAITQCPIAPEQSYTYRFKAAPYGTTWYHSHYSGQYAGGLIGPLIIHGPHDEYDQTIDLGPVMLTDWYHEDYYSLVEQTMSNATGAGPVVADNNLINGKNNFNCSALPANDTTPCVSDAGISKFNFKRGNKYMLRLINAGAEGLQRFSIDGHMLKVVSNDMVDVEPYMTEVVTLGIGQRSNVIVEANGELDAYWMRSSVSLGSCGLNDNPNALAAIYYDDTDTSIEPESEPWEFGNANHCTNDDLELTVPLCPLALPEPDITFTFNANITHNATGHTLWEFDDVVFMGNYNSPTLLWGILGNETFPNDPQWNVRNVGNAKSVRVVVNNLSGASHPMHLHGFNMYILHDGLGSWDNATIIRPENPQRRDVFQVRPKGHLVMQFDASENPGMWPFHCHIAWHVSGGFFIQFLTNPEELQQLQPPPEVCETCRQWANWTDTNIPPQIDSGL